MAWEATYLLSPTLLVLLAFGKRQGRGWAEEVSGGDSECRCQSQWSGAHAWLWGTS